MKGCYINNNVSELKREMQKNKMIILIYAPWCGHCNEMKEDWDTVIENIGGRDDLGGFISRIQIENIPKLKEPELEGINGVPTLIYYNKGDIDTFKGKRDAQHIEDWILDKFDKVKHESIHNDLGARTRDSVSLRKQKYKSQGRNSESRKRTKLLGNVGEIEKLHTMYGGYNWQKNKSLRLNTDIKMNRKRVTSGRVLTKKKTKKILSKRLLTDKIITKKSRSKKSKSKKTRIKKSRSKKSRSK